MGDIGRGPVSSSSWSRCSNWERSGPESPQTTLESRAALGRGCGGEGRPERCSAAWALHEELLAVFVLTKEGVDTAEAAAGDTRAVDGHATPAPTESSSATPAALPVGKNGHAAEGMRLLGPVHATRAVALRRFALRRRDNLRGLPTRTAPPAPGPVRRRRPLGSVADCVPLDAPPQAARPSTAAAGGQRTQLQVKQPAQSEPPKYRSAPLRTRLLVGPRPDAGRGIRPHERDDQEGRRLRAG